MPAAQNITWRGRRVPVRHDSVCGKLHAGPGCFGTQTCPAPRGVTSLVLPALLPGTQLGEQERGAPCPDVTTSAARTGLCSHQGLCRARGSLARWGRVYSSTPALGSVLLVEPKSPAPSRGRISGLPLKREKHRAAFASHLSGCWNSSFAQCSPRPPGWKELHMRQVCAGSVRGAGGDVSQTCKATSERPVCYV